LAAFITRERGRQVSSSGMAEFSGLITQI